MNSNINIFRDMNSIKELEVFHEGFAGLIRIAKQQGPTPGEVEGYKHHQDLIQARMDHLRGNMPTE